MLNIRVTISFRNIYLSLWWMDGNGPWFINGWRMLFGLSAHLCGHTTCFQLFIYACHNCDSSINFITLLIHINAIFIVCIVYRVKVCRFIVLYVFANVLTRVYPFPPILFLSFLFVLFLSSPLGFYPSFFSSANKFRIFACNIREKDDRDEELWKVTAVRIFQSYPKFIERYLFFVFTTPRFRVSIKIFIRVYLSRRLVSKKRSRFVFLERKRRKLELFDWFFRTWMEMDI